LRNNTLFVRDKEGLLDVKAEGYKAVFDIKLVVDANINNAYSLKGEYFRSFCYMIEYIGELFSNVSNKLNIDAVILEQLMHCISDIETLNIPAIIKKLGLVNCSYEKSSNSLLMDVGDIDMAIPLTGLVEDAKKYIIPELQKINWNRIDILVTSLLSPIYENELISITELYELFKKINGIYGIERMKGLGEMNSEHLKMTCLAPETRTYVNVTSPSSVDAIYNLLGVDTKARKQLVNKNVRK
jgi:hypothetical protein